MLRLERVHPSGASTTWEIVERSITFLQGDGIVSRLQRGKKLSESPDAAGVCDRERRPAFPPQIFECAVVKASRFRASGRLPARVEDFEKIATIGTAEVLLRMVGDVTAFDAAQARDRSCS